MAGLAIALGAWLLNASFGWRIAALFVVGAAAGVVLYHAAFGFTSAWRVFIADGRGAGLRAQMLMLAVTCAVFFPLLAAGEAFGTRLNGLVQPVGVPVLVGAFMFGIGMQLGGGCASGTLFTRGRRQHPDGGDAAVLRRRVAPRHGSLGVLGGAADLAAHLAGGALYGPVAALAMSLVVFGAIFVAHGGRRTAPVRTAGRSPSRRRGRSAGCAGRGRSSPARSGWPP